MFSRIVPGAFYLFAFLQFAVVVGWVKIDWTILNDIGIIPTLGLALFSYILGAAMDRLGFLWHMIFRKPGMSTRVLQRFREKHADRWQFDFEDKDWPILRAYIGIHHLDVAGELDRNNALCIMLRNISFGLLLFAVIQGVQFVNTRDWIHILLVILLIFFSYQLAIQATNLRYWFYSGIFETIIAYQLKLDERVKPVEIKRRTKTTK